MQLSSTELIIYYFKTVTVIVAF